MLASKSLCREDNLESLIIQRGLVTAQLVECLPAMYEAPGSSLSTTGTVCGGAHLQSQTAGELEVRVILGYT